jgi:hypothetical protein
MVQPFAFVSCDIVGHSAEKDLAVQLNRIRAINDVVRAVIGRAGSGQVVWASGGDGGHVALGMPDWPQVALDFLTRLRAWSVEAGLLLRLTAHYGEVDQCEGAEGRVQLVGPGINLAGRLLRHGGQGRVVVSEAFRAAAMAALPEARFHGDRLIGLDHFPPQRLFLLSVAGRWESAWDPPPPDDRHLLQQAAADRRAWDVIYHAKRLLQVNPQDPSATETLTGFTDLSFTYRKPANGEPALNDLLAPMDRYSRLEFLRGADLVERGPGGLLCRSGDEGDTMFLVLRGEVGVVAAAQEPEAAETYSWRFGPGAIVGELAFALDRRRTASLRCLGPTALLSFSFQQVQQLVQTSPFGGRIRERMDRFLKSRILEYLCNHLDFLIGKDRTGPLSRFPDPWEVLLDHTHVIDLSWEQGTVVSRDVATFRTPVCTSW